MRFSLLSILLSMFFVSSCGGGGDSQTAQTAQTAQPEKVNTPPVISPNIRLKDDSADGLIETSESFVILLKITDIDNDVITGYVNIDDNRAELTEYTGNEDFTHQANFLIATKGEKTASIIVSDGKSADVTSSQIVSIIPNTTEVQTILAAEIPNFILGGEFEGNALLGAITDEYDRNVGYMSTALTEDNLQHNTAPAGECGENTPHKLLSVNITTTDVIVPEAGLIFPLECISESQTDKLKASNEKRTASNKENKTQNSYIAQNFVINKDSEEGMTIDQTGSGISVEGTISDIICDDIVLPLYENEYRINNEQISSALDSLFATSNNFILTCYRTVEYEGEVKSSLLLATITGELTETDSTSPTGSIDSVTFSIPFQDGGLDQGEICATTTANDNSVALIEILTLHASDGLVEDVVMALQESTNKYCASLSGFDGGVHVTQKIIDGANNELTNTSETYAVEKNDAPVFSEELAGSILLSTNQGVVVLIKDEDISDPEGQEVTLNGETTFDTTLEVGTYSITAIATDPYNAQTSKTITIELSDNSAPTAQMALTGQYSMIGNALRDINETITLTLSSEDIDGHIVGSKLESRLNNESYSEITNYSSSYTQDISTEGGNARSFNYQVTDNNGLDSEIANIELDIHLNTAPSYQGETSYATQRGDCITVDKIAEDSESDDINYEIAGNNWQLCYSSPGLKTKIVTLSDVFQASSSVTISIDVDDCPAGQDWYNNTCMVVDNTPDSFSFNSFSVPGGSGPSYYYTQSITISGINTEVNIGVANGWYEINSSGGYSSGSGKVKNGDVVKVRVDMNDAGKQLTLTVGSYSAGFTIQDYGA